MNKVILKGRLTADAEIKATQNGVEYTQFSVAVDKFVKDGEKQADFIPCKAYRQTAVFVNKYFHKGSEILIDGSIRFDKYEKDGENRTFAYVLVNSVEFCGSKSTNDGNADSAQKPKKAKAEKVSSDVPNPNPDADDDDLPF